MKPHFAAFTLALIVLCAGIARAGQDQYLHVRMYSATLSAFWGQSVSIEANVLLPDSYYKEPQRHYPVMYWIQGFDGYGTITPRAELSWQKPMRRLHNEFIIVYLDGMFNGGHQEFADSANNGPWGTALVTEFIPRTEAHFRAIDTPQARFVGGHSSGGWSALWLQVTYPDTFGAEWSIAPDPVDFRSFTGPDLTLSPPQNFFTSSSGRAYELDGQTLRHFVLGPGWERRQFDSFDAVFSPKGLNGEPEPLFDRHTGRIDPAVAQYWETHYDIARLLRDHWDSLGPKLHGKLHIVVGTRDQYHLDSPVALLQKELQGLGSDAEINFAPGFDHDTIFNWDGSIFNYVITEASALAPKKESS